MKKKLLTILLSVFMIITTFTANVFAEGVKISDILPTYFPTTIDNGLTNVNGVKLYLNDNYLVFDGSAIDRGTFMVDISTKLTLIDNNKYKFTTSGKSIYLNMQDNRLISISVDDSNNEDKLTGSFVVPAPKVAKIDDTEYDTLAKAIEAASSGDTIELISDCDEDITLKDGVVFDIDDYNYSGDVTPLDNAKVAVTDNRNNPKRVAFYSDFNKALTGAKENDTVLLLKDISYATDGTGLFNITKSITLDGDEKYSISGYGSRSGNATTLAINNGGSSIVNVTLKNLTINNTGYKGRPIETRGNIGTLTLDKVTVNATGGGNKQGLTIGGNQSSKAKINIINKSNINLGNDGYAIITFNPAEITIENSTIKAWACMYLKGIDGSTGSRGSIIKAKNSNFISRNVNSAPTNDFAAFQMEDDNITIELDSCNVNAEPIGTNYQTVFGTYRPASRKSNGFKFTIKGDSIVTGTLLDDEWTTSDNRFLSIESGKFKSDFYLAGFPNSNDDALKKQIKGGYYTKDPTAYVADGYIAIVLTNDSTGPDKDAFGEGYRYKVIPKTSVEINESNYDSIQEAVKQIVEENKQKEINKEQIEKTTITVDNGTEPGQGINAEIDDTIVIVANTNDDNSVVGVPGYGVEETKNNGKSTYTAKALNIGEYKDGTELKTNGSGTKDSEKIDNKDSIIQGITVTPEVSASAGTVVDTHDNEYLQQIVAEIVASNTELAKLKLNQATAAKAINNAEKDIKNEDVSIKVTTDGEGEDVAAKEVSIFVKTYYYTVVTKEEKNNTTNKITSFTFDIKPMYQAFASTATVISDMEKTGETTVAMGEPKELDNLSGKKITLKFTLPAGFVTNENQKVYVIHTLADRTKKTYDSTITKVGNDFVISFDNPDGFSVFEFTLDNPNLVIEPSSKPKSSYVVPKTGVN